MSTILTHTDELHEFASFEGIKLAGTRVGEDSGFDKWLEEIDLHADVVDNHIEKELSGISGADFAKLDAKQFSALVKEALGEIILDDSGKPYGAEVAAPASGISGRGGTELG